MNEIFLDTETTGLSPNDGDRILEIACIETKDLIPTKKIFHKLINPERKVSQEAFKVHGFSNDFLQDKQKFKEIADELLEFIDGKKLIIHNAPFDIGFLNSELKKINKKVLDIKKVDDTLSLARSKFPASSNSLDNLCKRFNIDISRRTKHNALLDCELLREVYINLLDAKEPRLSFSEEPKSSIFKENKVKEEYSRKIVLPDKLELERHEKFLKNELKKNFY